MNAKQDTIIVDYLLKEVIHEKIVSMERCGHCGKTQLKNDIPCCSRCGSPSLP